MRKPPDQAPAADNTPPASTAVATVPAKRVAKKTAKPKAEAKSKGGRPEHVPTPQQRAQVRMLAAMSCSVDEIAMFLSVTEPISAPTVRKHYADDMQRARIEAKAKVAGALYRAATDNAKPNVVAGIFWLKTQAGWREDAGLPLQPPDRPGAEKAQEEQPGKKAAADLGAQTATLGTDWQDLLGRPGPPIQ